MIPPLFRWVTFRGAYANVLAFCLVALGGEWVVHQLAYLIEYGNRFRSVMETTPHRYYMGPVGAFVLVGVISMLAVSVLLVHSGARRRDGLLLLLPQRVRRLIPKAAVAIPVRHLLRTALILALLQAGAYVIQENLEIAAQGGALPTLAVLFSPEHLFVIPLHASLALCGSLLLWALSAHLRGSAVASAIAEALVRLFAPRPGDSVSRILVRECVSGLRTVRSSISPRAPPVLA